MISYEYLQFINEKAQEYLFPLGFKNIGGKLNGRCPICGDSHKSSTKKRGFYYMQNASYYCFNCGVSLPGIKLIEALSGQDYADIKKEYVKLFIKSGLNDNSLSAYHEAPVSEPNLFELKSVIRPEWKKPLSDKARSYLDKRMVLRAPFLKEDLYSCYGKNNDEFIMIPWVVNGTDAYYQLNDFQKLHSLKYIFPKNKHKLVYGLDEIDITWPYIIVFEGVYDSLFVKNAVAVGTKSVTAYQMKLIRERYPNHQICISFDNDEAGITSMIKMIERNEDVRYFKWFNQNTTGKDVNEYVLSKNDPTLFSNPKKLEKMISSQLQMKAWLIETGKWVSKKCNTRKHVMKSTIDLKSKAALLT